MKAQILSTDIVAGDAAGAKIFGIEPGRVPHLAAAAEMGLGSMDLGSLNIQRISL